MSDDAALTEYVDPAQLKLDVAIDATNLTDGMLQQTGLYVHYATQAVRARRQHERWKVALEILEAQLDSEHRKALKEENPKVTEPQVRAAIITDGRWKRASARVIDAQQCFRLADIAERSFDHRKDMLLQLARDAAREQTGGTNTMRVGATPEGRRALAEAMNTASRAA